MGLRDYQLIPFDEDQVFESFIGDYFNNLYSTFNFTKYGRNGQTQNGYDYYSIEQKIAIQCKQVDIKRNSKTICKELLRIIDKDFKAFSKYNSGLEIKFSKFIITSTFTDDTEIDQYCQKNSTADVIIEYWSWTKLKENMPEKTMNKFFSNFIQLLDRYYETKTALTFNRELFKSKNINELLDSLYSDYEILYKELNFLPTEILNEIVLKKFSSEVGFSPYEMDTTSKVFYELISRVSSDKKKKLNLSNSKGINDVESALPKLKFIIEKLQSQAVYSLQYQDKSFSLPFISKESCKCSRCRLHFFDFESIDFSYHSNDESEFDYLFKKAFTFFKLGNFKDAINNYKLCLQIAENDHNEINIFRTKYNLIKIRTSIYNHHYFENETDIDIKQLKVIKLDEFGCNAKSELAKELIQWMSHDHYITDSFYRISQKRDEVIKSYFISHGKGFSSNGFINDIAFEYSQINLFLENNCIVYENFTEFRQIVHCFMEAMIASYGTNERSSRTTRFNDWILIQFLKFGDFDLVKTYLTKYNVKNILYKPSYPKGQQITDIIISLFQQIETAENFLPHADQYSRRLFRNNYKRWLNNAFSIIRMMDFSPEWIKKIFTIIPDLLKNPNVEVDQYKLLSLLISKANYITPQLWKSILIAGLKNQKKTIVYFYNLMAEIAIDNNLEITFNNKDFKTIQSKLKGNIPTNYLCALHIARSTANQEQQSNLVSIFENQINSFTEVNIAYCLGLIYKMVKLKDNYLNQLIIKYSRSEPIKSSYNNFHGQPNYNGDLDLLIEALYKFEIDLKEDRFKGLNNHGIYYQWLLNLDTFDYSQFDPQWILCYIRKSYTKRFARCIPLKEAIENHIISSEQTNKTAIQERYFEIYLKK
ncbi:hypothetical protein [Fluviicola sp.]|uniref:hypothetical protein n=1 Tax=Fluviicola sp. TaxID=1917219 RepID=UPI003D2956DE